MIRSTVLSAACAVTLALTAGGRAEPASTNELLAHLPESANTVVVINMKAIRQLSKGTPDAGGFQIVAGVPVPPTVDLVVFATDLEPGNLDARKTVGLIQLNRNLTIDDLLDKTRGNKIDLGGEAAVVHPRKGFYVLLAPDLIGIGRNITRQELVRGIKFARTNKKVLLRSYLTDVIAGAAESPIVGVLDMEHMLDAQGVRAGLAASEMMAGRDKAELDSIAALVASIKGTSLTVGGANLDQAEVRLDFGTPVAGRGELVKSLFLQALEDHGVALSDFEKATVAASDQTVKLQVKLSGEGLIRIMSIFMPPAPDVVAQAAAPKLESNGISIDATRRYYQSIIPMLADLQKRSKNITDYPKTATWHETYSAQIENLSTRYVDPDMVKFGESVSERLRAIAYSLRGASVQAEALQQGKVYVALATGGWFSSSSNVESNVAQIRTQQGELARKDAARRLEIWESIDKDGRGIIKTMRDKYKLNLQ